VGANLFRAEPGTTILDALEGRAEATDITAQLFVQYANQPGNDPVALACVLRRPARRTLTPERLAALTMPVLVVLGEKDFAGPADPLVEALPNARLVTLRNTDHFATTESFAAIDATLEFLGALPA
jgi:pimeloyl-ACP methyl ester carboxylesterase